jgi:hypothetical protein
MNQLPAWRVNKCAVHYVTGSEFHLLTERTNVNGLVTLNTPGVVVGWSKTIFDSLAFGEDEFVVFKPAVPARGGCYRLVHAFHYWCALNAEAVEQVIGFGVHVSSRCFSSSLTFDNLGVTQGQEQRDRKEK